MAPGVDAAGSEGELRQNTSSRTENGLGRAELGEGKHYQAFETIHRSF